MERLMLAVGLLAAVGVAPVHGQDVDFGLKGGVNLAELDGGDLLDDVVSVLDRRTGVAAGLFVRLPVGSVLALQPEALYSQRGASLDLPVGEATIELDYVDLALALRVDLLPESPVRPYLLGGPYAGFNVRARAVARVLVEVADEDLEDIVRDTEFGLLAGGGLRFVAGGVNLDLEARYARGLTGVEDVAGGDEVKNQVFSFLAGVSF